MRTKGWKISIAAVVILSLMIIPLLSRGEHEHGSHQENNTVAGPSPLVEEMVRLDAVFRDVVSGVALGDGGRVHAAIETMHGAMEKTHEGVHEGTVALRKNAGRLSEFISRDKQFHEKLEELAHAAERNDQNRMTMLTKELLDGCVNCHRDFRQP